MQWRFKGLGVGILLVMLAATLLTGCATATVIVKPNTKLEAYRKICIIVPDAEEDPRNVHPRIVSRLQRCGFRVVELSTDGSAVNSQGTGSIISPEGHVLTCAHVVGTLTNATIWVNNARYLCNVVATDTNLDLAVLLVNGSHKPFEALPFAANTNYVMGQDAFTLGFPLAEIIGTSPRLNKGLISATVGMEDSADHLQVSAAVQPGNSGGPLLNNDGEMLGVTVSTLNPMQVLMRSGGNLPQNVNFAIKSSRVMDFLQHAGIPYRISSGTNGGFEGARNSLALVRSGNISDEDVKMPALICVGSYVWLWDMFYRFRAIQLDFYDYSKGDRVFRVGQYRDDMFSSEDATLDRLFSEVSVHFFPTQENPFRTSRKSANVSSK